MTDYPGAITSFATLVDYVDWVLATHQNTRANEIVAVQTALGTNPRGNAASLKARLAHSIDDDGYLNFDSATELTITSDAITITQNAHKLQPQTTTADNLSTINGTVDGDAGVLYVSDFGTDTITIKHNVGNILCVGAADIVLSHGCVYWYSNGTKVFMSGGGGGASAGGGLAFGGRLTGLSGVAVPFTNLTGLTSLFLTPHKGDQLPLWGGTAFAMSTFAEMQLTFNATPHPANTNHDVFYFNDGGTKRIGSVKWRNSGQAITAATNANPCVITSNAHGISNGDIVSLVMVFASATYYGEYAASSVAANTITFTGINSTSDGTFLGGYINCRGVGAGTAELEIVNGIYVNKNSITAYYSASSASVAARYGTYIGSFRTTATNAQTEQSKSRAFVWNLYNQVDNELYCRDTTDSWTYTLLAFRASNGTTGLTVGVGRVECVVGIAGCEAQAIANDTAANSGFVNMAGGIGINTTTSNFAQTFGSVNVTGSWCSMVASLNTKLLAGHNFIQHLESSVATGTTTWAGDLGNVVMQTGIVAKVKG